MSSSLLFAAYGLHPTGVNNMRFFYFVMYTTPTLCYYIGMLFLKKNFSRTDYSPLLGDDATDASLQLCIDGQRIDRSASKSTILRVSTALYRIRQFSFIWGRQSRRISPTLH